MQVCSLVVHARPKAMDDVRVDLEAMPRRGRLLAVLGEMRELGADAERLHRSIGEEAGRVFDACCVIDAGSGATLAKAAGATLVPDRDAARAWLEAQAGAGDLVLVKASHGVALDQLTESLS